MLSSKRLHSSRTSIVASAVLLLVQFLAFSLLFNFEEEKTGTTSSSSSHRGTSGHLRRPSHHAGVVLASASLSSTRKSIHDGHLVQDHQGTPGKNFHIVIMADDGFRDRYRRQIRSVQCYADHWGYPFIVLNPNAEKNPYSSAECRANNDVFYVRHCLLAEYLDAKQKTGEANPDTVALLIDADVAARDLNPSMDHYIQKMKDYDLMFFERKWGPGGHNEVMAGAYMARNTPKAKKFLRYWDGLNARKPPGFASADNGAIHLALYEATGVVVTGKELPADYQESHQLHQGEPVLFLQEQASSSQGQSSPPDPIVYHSKSCDEKKKDQSSSPSTFSLSSQAQESKKKKKGKKQEKEGDKNNSTKKVKDPQEDEDPHPEDQDADEVGSEQAEAERIMAQVLTQHSKENLVLTPTRLDANGKPLDTMKMPRGTSTRKAGASTGGARGNVDQSQSAPASGFLQTSMSSASRRLMRRVSEEGKQNQMSPSTAGTSQTSGEDEHELAMRGIERSMLKVAGMAHVGGTSPILASGLSESIIESHGGQLVARWTPSSRFKNGIQLAETGRSKTASANANGVNVASKNLMYSAHQISKTDAEACTKQYYGLVAKVDNMHPYEDWLGCVRSLLHIGPGPTPWFTYQAKDPHFVESQDFEKANGMLLLGVNNTLLSSRPDAVIPGIKVRVLAKDHAFVPDFGSVERSTPLGHSVKNFDGARHWLHWKDVEKCEPKA
ncbi:unnamed protein product [Amoebophrya sp. A25]|nr:unnamed protein product [Amoebophrya sp. A25]|eukprot:GSA25T00016891001.1